MQHENANIRSLMPQVDFMGAVNNGIILPPQGISMAGRVTCTYDDFDAHGNLIESGVLHYKGNIILNLARENLCYLLSAAQSDRYIKTFKIGTKGNATGDILTPVAPQATDVALTDPSPFVKDLSSFKLLPDSGTKNEIQFNVALEPAEANGDSGAAVAYTEALLVTAKGEGFAKETFPAIVKTSTRRINFSWSILF